MSSIEVKEKYKDYLNTREGVDNYNKFKKILYGTPDSLVIRVADFLLPEVEKKHLNIIDIGGGDGKRLRLLISILNSKGIKTSTVLVDQSSVFVDDLKESLKSDKSGYDIRPFCSTFENFVSDEKFDLILLIHSIYTFKDTSYIRKIKQMLKPDGRVLLIADSADSFLAKLKEITDSTFGTKRKNITSVIEDLKVNGFNVQSTISLTTYDECLKDGYLNDNGRLILSWIALRDYKYLSATIIKDATNLFIKYSKDGRIHDEEIFVVAKID